MPKSTQRLKSLQALGYIGYALFILFLLELSLYVACFKPGYYNQRFDSEIQLFRKVDTLKLLPIFYPDSDGITKINIDGCSLDSDAWTIKKLYWDYICGVSLNSDGFRTREFSDTALDHKKTKRVIFLGDSFTFGYSAQPISNSFVDLIEKNGAIKTYNLGVPGSDVTTYLKLLERHLNQIRPEKVVINFFIRNDCIEYDKQLAPSQFNDIFVSNAGVTYKSIKQPQTNLILEFESAQDSYRYTLDKLSLFNKISWTAKLASKSNLTTQLFRFTLKDSEDALSINYKSHVAKKHTAAILDEIEKLCSIYSVELALVVIPGATDDSTIMKRVITTQIPNYENTFFYPSNLLTSDFVPGRDGHFNNVGHQKYADFLKDSVLKE